jgi:RNA polymerase sigma-70 factor (ECF subfamily)
MPAIPLTRATLLVRLRDPGDSEAWSQFVEVYAPVIYAIGRRQGLQDADAADLAQVVLLSVSRAIQRLDYDPERGRFRSWLYTVCRTKLANLQQRQRRQAAAAGGTTALNALDQQPAPAADRDQWEAECERRLFHFAAEQVRPAFEEKTWQAFWRTAVENQRPQQVAAELGLSTGAVYIAKSRVIAKLREAIEGIENAT